MHWPTLMPGGEGDLGGVTVGMQENTVQDGISTFVSGSHWILIYSFGRFTAVLVVTKQTKLVLKEPDKPTHDHFFTITM